jgi:hypothetical protein
MTLQMNSQVDEEMTKNHGSADATPAASVCTGVLWSTDPNDSITTV